jgi:ribosomal protein S8
MKWGKKKGVSVSDISRLANKNRKLQNKLSKTTAKSEKNQVKVDKLTKKLTKHGGYITDIGYTLAKNTGRKLARKLHRGKKLEKKIAKVQSRLDKNRTLMTSKVRDLPKDQIKLGRDIFAFYITKNGIYPRGMDADNYEKDCNPSGSSSFGYGYSCTAKVIQEGGINY